MQSLINTYTSLPAPKKKIFDLVLWLFLAVIVLLIGRSVPPGLDWRLFFSHQETFPAFYPTWLKLSIPLLPWELYFSISVLAIIWGNFRKGGRALSIFAALLTLPAWMWLFLGNIDGIIALGVLTLPYGIPLVLAKLPIAGFALLAKKEWMLYALIATIILYLIFGWWPGDIFSGKANLAPATITSSFPDHWANISLFPYSLILSIPLLFFSRGDVDLLMAAGALGTPYVQMYHYVVLLPAMGRINRWLAFALVPISWLPYILRAAGGESWAWILCNLFPILIWIGIFQRNPNDVKGRARQELTNILRVLRLKKLPLKT